MNGSFRDFLESKFGNFNLTHPIIGLDWEDIVNAHEEFAALIDKGEDYKKGYEDGYSKGVKDAGSPYS